MTVMDERLYRVAGAFETEDLMRIEGRQYQLMAMS
jgi:hypothetical protein